MKSALNSDSQRFSSPLGSTSFLFLFTTVFLSLNLVYSTFSQAWQGRSKEGLFTPCCKISKKLWNPTCRCLAARRLASVRVTIFDDRLPSLCLQSTRHQIAVAKQPMHSSLGKPHPKKKHVYLGIAQTAIWPPLLRKSRHFVAQIFCRKWENSLNSQCDFGNEYFDSD